MGDHDGTDRNAGGMNSWRAGCVETRTSGSEGGLRKRTGRKTGTAPQPDPYVWRDQAEHAAQSLAKGSRIVILGRLQQRSWTAEDGSTRSTIEVVADELGPSLRRATATTTRATRSQAKPAPLGRRR
jgi:single-stranded DNA-binding protein